MELILEPSNKHSIQSYQDDCIQIASVIYSKSLIVTPQEIFLDWNIKKLSELQESDLEQLMRSQPKIILIAYPLSQQAFIPYQLIPLCGMRGVGLEFMPIGAACRTFNVLLNEEREIAFGFIPESMSSNETNRE
ncbi:MAG: hypothetical protein H2069_02415 [Legionella sp.]|nr:hypothetical protein [Legionella sp.]